MKWAACRARRSFAAASSALSRLMVAACRSACASAEPARALSASLLFFRPLPAVGLLESGQRCLQPGDLAGLILGARLERPDLALLLGPARVRCRRGRRRGAHRVQGGFGLGEVFARPVDVGYRPASGAGSIATGPGTT